MQLLLCYYPTLVTEGVLMQLLLCYYPTLVTKESLCSEAAIYIYIYNYIYIYIYCILIHMQAVNKDRIPLAGAF